MRVVQHNPKQLELRRYYFTPRLHDPDVATRIPRLIVQVALLRMQPETSQNDKTFNYKKKTHLLMSAQESGGRRM